MAALHGGCRIIPITDEAFLWPDENSLPVDIRAVTRYQSIPSVLIELHNDDSKRLLDIAMLLYCYRAVKDYNFN